jgi:hypothetical protein
MIVSKNIKELASQLADKKVKFLVNNGYAQNCYTKKGKVRKLDRVIDTNIKQAISDKVN